MAKKDGFSNLDFHGGADAKLDWNGPKIITLVEERTNQGMWDLVMAIVAEAKKNIGSGSRLVKGFTEKKSGKMRGGIYSGKAKTGVWFARAKFPGGFVDQGHAIRATKGGPEVGRAKPKPFFSDAVESVTGDLEKYIREVNR